MATHPPRRGKFPRVPTAKPSKVMKSPEDRRISRQSEKADLRKGLDRGKVKVW